MLHLPDHVQEDNHREKVLFCGWRRDIGDMILLLDELVQPESILDIMCEVTPTERNEQLLYNGRDLTQLQNLKLKHLEGNPYMRHHLEKLDLLTYSSILVLSNEADEGSAMDTDSKAISTLILIRDIQSQLMAEKEYEFVIEDNLEVTESGWQNALFHAASMKVQIVAEILDTETKHLMRSTSTFGTEYIMSNELISMYIGMVAEAQDINPVLQELMSAEGQEIYIQDISIYIDLAIENDISIWTLMGRARLRPVPEVILGYRRGKEPVTINPTGSESHSRHAVYSKLTPIKWKRGDTIIVLADTPDPDPTLDCTSPRSPLRLNRMRTKSGLKEDSGS